MKNLKIILTGGPGGGKTTALDLFRREFLDEVAVVPEAATILFERGIPRGHTPDTRKLTQESIYFMQKNLEKIYRNMNPDKLLLCDRGTLDGLAYWPGDEDDFFNFVDSDYEKELNRYDAVIFFQTGACSGKDISTNNPLRLEDTNEAIQLDTRLQAIWKKHKNFHLVGSSESFLEKINFGIKTIEKVINES